MPKASILISSKNRLPLFRRSLWSIAARPPSVPFEVVVADDNSTDDILGELHRHDANFDWVFVRVDTAVFTRATGVARFWNCPALTNNAAFAFSRGEAVFQMGNEIIAWEGVFDSLLDGLGPLGRNAWAVSDTFDVPQETLDRLDGDGRNLTQADVEACYPRRLSNDNNVPNYLSVFTRGAWEAVGGYDERYLAGIGAEDSDFMRRVMSLPGFRMARNRGISLHQYHGGVSHLYRPQPHVITEERLAYGAAINRTLYRAWDETTSNRMPWKPAEFGVGEVTVHARPF
jgi:glycosyltransferase involved in cell wall biosynthesis